MTSEFQVRTASGVGKLEISTSHGASCHEGDSHTHPDPLRIVVFGGGAGLSTLLRGLKRFTFEAASSLHITAVVAVSDDGGSSGRLRRDFEILAPGDIRNCMIALAEDENLLSRLFQYRFANGNGLKGHSFGNLFLTALADITGDFHQAVQFSSEVLAIRGRIYPSTLANVQLQAELENGDSIVGESKISSAERRIQRLRLLPRDCDPLPQTLEAIASSDLIVLGPGSLYTSVIPNLLVNGIPEAIAASRAIKAYICNLMEQRGETSNYTASDHLRALCSHSGVPIVDHVVVNSERLPPPNGSNGAQTLKPVEVDQRALEEFGVSVLAEPLAAKDGSLRHDPDCLARAIVGLAARSALRTA